MNTSPRPGRQQLFMLSKPRAIMALLLRLARDPIEAARSFPLISWPAMLALQAGAAAISGLIFGAIAGSLLQSAIATVVFPAVAISSAFAIALFLRAVCFVVSNKRPTLRSVASLVTIALLPHLLLHSISGLIPPIDLIGFLIVCALLCVGLTERISLPRRSAIGIALAIYGLFFASWSWSQARTWRVDNERANARGTERRSLDELERTLNK